MPSIAPRFGRPFLYGSQRRNTSAMILEVQLLLSVSLGRVLRPLSKYLESIVLQRGGGKHEWKTLKTDSNLSKSGRLH